MADPDHSRAIAQAATKRLVPLGLRQRGRSRTWLDDHGWWVGVVEFQPSSWSQGSYLNVGCNWLWHVKDWLSFSFSTDARGPRVEAFHAHQPGQDFGANAQLLVESAAEAIERLRALLPNVAAAAEILETRAGVDQLRQLDAGIANALAGRLELAQRNLTAAARHAGVDWIETNRAEATRLLALVGSQEEFEEEIRTRIYKTRELLKLTAVDLGPF